MNMSDDTSKFAIAINGVDYPILSDLLPNSGITTVNRTCKAPLQNSTLTADTTPYTVLGVAFLRNVYV